jgi:hypothetical protein
METSETDIAVLKLKKCSLGSFPDSHCHAKVYRKLIGHCCGKCSVDPLFSVPNPGL